MYFFFMLRSKQLRLVLLTLFALWISLFSSAAFTSAAPVSNPSEIKSNWAGQEFYGAPNEFTSIKADWAVPCIVPDPNNTSHTSEASSIWVGLGGVTRDSVSGRRKNLVQTGTEQDVSYDANGNAHTRYYAWVANLGLPSPANQDQIVFDVPCGHRIHAEVVSPNTLSIRDLDGTSSFQKSVGPDADMSTAEFIVERPTLNRKHTKLANFQQITFSGCTAFSVAARAELPLGGNSQYKTITMVDDEHNNKPMVEVLPAIINAQTNDSSFAVKWIRSGL